MKSGKMPYINYGDIESLTKKIDRWANNPEKSSTTNHIENEHTLISWKWLYEKVFYFFKKHMKNIINFEKKKCYG